MIERIDDAPAGVTALRASGKLTKDDYTQVLEPALDAAIAAGDLRLLFELDDFDGLESGAWAEDAKTGAKALVRDHKAWKRFALVTDVDWVAKGARAFAWLTPCEIKVFPLAEGAAAREWVAGN